MLGARCSFLEHWYTLLMTLSKGDQSPTVCRKQGRQLISSPSIQGTGTLTNDLQVKRDLTPD